MKEQNGRPESEKWKGGMKGMNERNGRTEWKKMKVEMEGRKDPLRFL
jgi:hypothetical protein